MPKLLVFFRRLLYPAFAACLAFSPKVFAASQPFAEATPPRPSILLGTAWYPEQWPESRWETDLQLMQQAHMHVVRVAEFAWSALEPSEEHFDFGWLDRAIALAAKHNIAVVLGTPTAAPPAWLTSKYPDTLRIEEDGHRAEHGGRLQYSFSSPRYRLFARRIAEQMALHYGHNPNVLGWQIDNEISTLSFDPITAQQFHQWLRHRYGTIAELNRRWTTAYWSQTYDTFDQVPFHSRNENPALLLDFKRFVTDTWVSYLDNQTSALRAHIDPRQFITTNTMHFNAGFDHYIVHKNLDIAAWDDYMPTGHLDPHLNALEHDLVRGYKNKNFWLMETQPGFVNWGEINRALDPGVVREMAWQAIAHGADAVLYWQWRSALNGQEQYHGSLLGPDGTPVPIYAEIQQLGADLDRLGPDFSGTAPHNTVALINDYDSRWAIDFQRHTRAFEYTQLMQEWYTALEPLTSGIDVISASTPLDQYKVVFAPALNVLPESVAHHLRDYVLHGGTLVLGPRSGMKDRDNALNPQCQPGPLVDLLGAHVEQFYALDAPVTLAGKDLFGKASIWAEQLTPTAPDAKVLLRYTSGNGWLNNQPAAITRAAGTGAITYLGAWMDAPLTASLFKTLLATAHAPGPAFTVPDGVELAERSSNSIDLYFLLNHTASSQSIQTPANLHNLLDPGTTAAITLPPHGVAVLSSQETHAAP